MANDLWSWECTTEKSLGFEDQSTYSKKEEEMCTSLYQLLYCWNRRGGQNIDCSSHCQIKNVSKLKPFGFFFFFFFLRQFFVRSKTNIVISYMKTTFILKKAVVVNRLGVQTHRSKQFCGLTLFRGKKELPSLFFRRCLSLLLGREGSVFLDAWYGRTRWRMGVQQISGGRCERGGYGNVC